MIRRNVVRLLLTILLLTVSLAEAQQQAKVPSIGWLSSGFGLASARTLFRRELREPDYVDGKNRDFETRTAQGSKLDPLHALADELVRLKLDVLLAPSTAEALAFKNATRTIPIVFIVSSDPVADGLVDSLARPGGNITGVTTIATELAGKRLELIKETIPKLSRVAVLWDSQDPSSAQHWRESQFAARELGLQLHSMQVSSVDKLEGAFKEATKARSAALAVTAGSFATSNPKLITNLAAKHRLPAIFDRGEFVASGGLMSYGPDQVESYRRAASMVDKILKGTKPADIPVEQPTKFELVINLKTAKALGLTIPPIVLMRATKVIK
jgi:putative ABC transport system substrate-binding protein